MYNINRIAWGDNNMTIKIDLEDWFDYVILMRGKEYFLDDRVIDLKKQDLDTRQKFMVVDCIM